MITPRAFGDGSGDRSADRPCGATTGRWSVRLLADATSRDALYPFWDKQHFITRMERCSLEKTGVGWNRQCRSQPLPSDPVLYRCIRENVPVFPGCGQFGPLGSASISRAPILILQSRRCRMKTIPKKYFPAIASRFPEPMLIGQAADTRSAGRLSGAACRSLRCSSSGNPGSGHLRRQSRLVILLVGIRMAGRAGVAVPSCRKEVVRSRCFALSSTSTSVAFAVRSSSSRRSPVARNALRRGLAGH